MLQANAKAIQIEDIPNAGRGVLALKPISKNTLLLSSERPVAHVIFREYRKEVCAQCFFYDRGRTLPTKHSTIGKVFCNQHCEDQWLDERGEVGVAAWRALNEFVKSKSKAISSHQVLLLTERPGVHDITSAWDKAEAQSQLQTDSAGLVNSARAIKDVGRAFRTVDPDVLAYLLSGLLCYYRQPDHWREQVSDLAMDDTPYRDILDLEAHCNSFVQLSTILPEQLRTQLTSELCRDLISATSHNSFGIRAGSEEAEEYMGYALYPEASYFNHSCSPNIGKKRIGGSWEFRALGDIVEGEQCCITYLGGDEKDLSADARRARLRMHWGFECMCERCQRESEFER